MIESYKMKFADKLRLGLFLTFVAGAASFILYALHAPGWFAFFPGVIIGAYASINK